MGNVEWIKHVGACVALVALAGCSNEMGVEEREWIEVGGTSCHWGVNLVDEPLPRYDAWFVWEHRGPRDTRVWEQATYSFNGRDVGTGDDGFRELISQLTALPEGSVVLAYPFIKRPPLERSYGDGPHYPFDARWNWLTEACQQRKLRVIFSEHDPRLSQPTSASLTD